MENEIQTFLNILNPDDSTTGGGSASAVAGAMAASLAAMVCRLSTKGRNEEELAFLDSSAAKTRDLSRQLLLGSSQDTLAFQAVSQAYQLPKDTDEQRSARSLAIQKAWARAARVPLENAGLCLDLYKAASNLEGRINPNTASDLHCALLLARAGLLGCLENVVINLPSIKDESASASLAEEAARLRRELETFEIPL